MAIGRWGAMARPRAVRWGRWVLLGLLALVVLAALAESRGALASVRQIGWRTVVLLLGATTVAYGLRAAKWHAMARARSPVPLGYSLAVFLSGLVLSLTPGKVAELWKAYAVAKRTDVPTGRMVPVVLLERLMDLIAVTAMALLALHWLPGLWPLIAAVAILLGLAAAFLWRRPWAGLRQWAEIRPRWHGLVRAVEEALRSMRVLLRPAMLSVVLALSLLAWSLEGLTLWIALEALQAPVDVPTALAVFAVSTLAGALSFIPGGVLAAEASMVALLVSQGVGTAEAAAATLVVRGVTLWYGVGLGGAAFTTLRVRAG